MTRLSLIAVAVLAALAATAPPAAGPLAAAVERPGSAEAARQPVGVLVEQTVDASPATLRAARAEVHRLRATGRRAELRVAASPSQALGAAATLAVRGAGRIVAYGADSVVVETLRSRGIDVVERP